MMRVILLSAALMMAGSAMAQTGPVILSAPQTTPVDGWGADAGPPRSSSGTRYQEAQYLMSQGRYAEAEPIIDKLMQSNSVRAHFLKGINKLGLNDPASARHYLQRIAGNPGSGDPGALSGLAIAEARLGNEQAAHSILNSLKAREAKCADNCGHASALRNAVDVVEKVVS